MGRLKQLRHHGKSEKGRYGGVNDTRTSTKKKGIAAVDAIILMLGKGWAPFTNTYVEMGIQVDLTILSLTKLKVFLENPVKESTKKNTRNDSSRFVNIGETRASNGGQAYGR